jgi:prevent-host-death family protein
MRTFTIHEAKSQFSGLMRQVEQGEAVLIARGGVVIARITPERASTKFKIGRDAGKGKIGDDFDAPLEVVPRGRAARDFNTTSRSLGTPSCYTCAPSG